MGTTTVNQAETVIHGARILVAEDDESFRGYVSQALRWAGFAVETSHDGRDVLARLEACAERGALPDLLLTDVQMPHTDGLRLLSEARERWPSLPVVLMTCHGEHEVLREALRIGCQGFLDKPFKVDELEAVIRKTLGEQKRLQQSLEIRRLGSDWQTSSGRFRLPEQRQRIGNYEVLEEIARGAMGVVYKASQVGLDRVVALKVTREGGDGTFLREARAMARLRHPNIAVVHEVGVEDGVEFFSMEYVDGCSLAEWIEQAPLTPRQAVELLGAVADGLAHVHALEILHKDIKPSNILIARQSGSEGTGFERPVLVDFGISTDKRAMSAARPAFLQGTLNYMAPEYAAGERYDERCDIFSFGVVLYEALAGRKLLPYWQPPLPRDELARGPQVLVERYARTAFVPLEERRPDLPRALTEVVRRAVARSRERRFPTIRALADALQGLDLA